MSDKDLAEGMGPRHVEVQQVYTNGFNLAGSLSDMNLLLMVDGVPHTQIHMSFTTAKTLMVEITAALTQIEQLTGNRIMPMETLRDAYDGTKK
ncbi:hypothetical protein ILP92_11595 [Maribius pontilimi]|uniref:DUF3467 domain-containing protein n=1 Tax=Palleronia pontilimi TaxID=1964209 RepID=A0A934IA96_9RHOB|nr:hypothetical protein [Palleronia pontilimi]MBJ3763389.1 hypothetical protein [Palleronia pontilimi]